MSTAAAPPRAPPGLPPRPTRLNRLPSLEQIRAKVAPPASSHASLSSDVRLSVSLPARPSSAPPPDGPALRSLLGRHPPSVSALRHASGPRPGISPMVQPPLAGQRASSVTGPSLQAIRERVGGSTIGRLTAPSPPQITVTTDGQQTTDIRLDQKGYLSGQESLPATSIDKDEDWARQLKDQDLPLQHVWSWTYTPPMSSHASSSAGTYSSAFVALGELRTVQDWAKHVNHIPPPSSLAKGANYSLFRGGIEPVYEDVQHKQGGRWVLTLRGLSVEQSAAAIDRCWAEVMMALIGGMLPTEGEVACTGAVVGIRHRGDRLQLWTSTKASAAPIQYLGERLFLLLQQTLEGVRVIGGGYMLDFQSNFPSPGGNPRIRGWNSDTGPLLPRNAGWR